MRSGMTSDMKIGHLQELQELEDLRLDRLCLTEERRRSHTVHRLMLSMAHTRVHSMVDHLQPHTLLQREHKLPHNLQHQYTANLVPQHPMALRHRLVQCLLCAHPGHNLMGQEPGHLHGVDFRKKRGKTKSTLRVRRTTPGEIAFLVG